MSVTFCVSNFDTSSVVRVEQSRNMPPIFVTFCVSNFDTSSVVSAEHSLNMPLMLVTFSVFRCSMPSMSVKYPQQ